MKLNIPFRGWQPPIHEGALPYDARQILKEAAAAPIEIRRMAVDAAIDRVMLMYPQFFKQGDSK